MWKKPLQTLLFIYFAKLSIPDNIIIQPEPSFLAAES
jgi:hypothetical protein